MSLLYEDEFVSVNEVALTIKNYHFPSKKVKCIPIEAIRVLWFEEQDRTKCPTKMWGKSTTFVYWALDVKSYKIRSQELPSTLNGVHSAEMQDRRLEKRLELMS
ncbi:unnamed protein product [Cylicostephanus goldi]|uniref:Uncharacterized protein n=1 Tax=Cylicostephanus goldi TaxID=71465 RepID=A0A3P6R8P1_CYLGO|nr:unnamed protein product [Cylicostephanus goldi]